MDKSTRLALIKARAAIVFSATGFLSISRAEIREEVRNATTHEVTSNVTDDELDGVQSQLAFDRVTLAKEREEDSLLSAKERAQLAKDFAAAQLAKRLKFAIVLRPNDESELDLYRKLCNFAHS